MRGEWGEGRELLLIAINSLLLAASHCDLFKAFNALGAFGVIKLKLNISTRRGKSTWHAPSSSLPSPFAYFPPHSRK